MFVESFDGTRIFYTLVKRPGPVLVFIHGWTNDWTTWEKEIAFCQKMGYPTLSLDLRGHGQSDKPESKEQYRLQCFARDINAIVTKERINEFVLIGHSMGGMISLTYYKLFNKEARIDALVLCDTTYRNVMEHKTIKALSPFIGHILDFLISHESIRNKHFSHLKDIDLNRYAHSSDYYVFYKSLHNTPMKSVFACLEAMMDFDVSGILGEISVPVLIIEGTDDKLLPAVDSLEMYSEIEDAEIDFVPGGRHFVNLESPELVDRYIISFLEKQGL